jgi:hypothetical protein
LRQVVAARQAGERDVRVLRFLTDQVLPDRTQTAVLRNVVADLLSDADYDLPRVWAQHAAAAFHAEESEAWRDYAVQHLVQVAERAGRVPETSALLRQLMAGDGGLAGTALLLWSRQQEGSMAAPAAVSADSSPELATVARGLLERSTHAGAQGVAVSVLGRLGAAEDGPRIAAQLRASSPTVRRAALAALRVHPFGPSAAKLITRLAAADPDPSVRQVAASSASAPSAPRPPAAAGDTP